MSYIYCKPSNNVTKILTEMHEKPFPGPIKEEESNKDLALLKKYW